jgi:hypothetical protein
MNNIKTTYHIYRLFGMGLALKCLFPILKGFQKRDFYILRPSCFKEFKLLKKSNVKTLSCLRCILPLFDTSLTVIERLFSKNKS